MILMLYLCAFRDVYVAKYDTAFNDLNAVFVSWLPYACLWNCQQQIITSLKMLCTKDHSFWTGGIRFRFQAVTRARGNTKRGPCFIATAAAKFLFCSSSCNNHGRKKRWFWRRWVHSNLVYTVTYLRTHITVLLPLATEFFMELDNIHGFDETDLQEAPADAAELQ